MPDSRLFRAVLKIDSVKILAKHEEHSVSESIECLSLIDYFWIKEVEILG